MFVIGSGSGSGIGFGGDGAVPGRPLTGAAVRPPLTIVDVELLGGVLPEPAGFA